MTSLSCGGNSPMSNDVPDMIERTLTSVTCLENCKTEGEIRSELFDEASDTVLTNTTKVELTSIDNRAEIQPIEQHPADNSPNVRSLSTVPRDVSSGYNNQNDGGVSQKNEHKQTDASTSTPERTAPTAISPADALVKGEKMCSSAVEDISMISLDISAAGSSVGSSSDRVDSIDGVIASSQSLALSLSSVSSVEKVSHMLETPVSTGADDATVSPGAQLPNILSETTGIGEDGRPAAVNLDEVGQCDAAVDGSMSVGDSSVDADEQLHCLVCNVSVSAESGVRLSTNLDTFKVRVADKLADVINKDYKLYLHSDLVCDNCLNVLTEIHHQEMETKRLKDVVMGDFWETVETRGIRPQRRGRKRSQRSKELMEHDDNEFVPEMLRYQDPPDLSRLPPKKSKSTNASDKSKIYIKLGACSYQCVRCLKCFPRMRTVVKHHNIVHGKNEVQCRFCHKFFRDRAHLLKHKKRFHEETESKETASAAAADKTGAASNTAADIGDILALSALAVNSDAEFLPDGDAATCRKQLRNAPGSQFPVDEEVGLEAGLVESRLEDEDDEEGDDAAGGSRRVPVITEDDEDCEADEGGVSLDMDVVMNVSGETDSSSISGRRRRRRQSDVARDNRHMFTEVFDPDSSGSTRYQCLLCSNSYSRQAKARDHFMAKHAQVRRFSCGVCSQMFLTYKQKRHHELSHTAEACSKCGKKYPGNRRGMLERHMIQCGQLKKCKTCDAEFATVGECLRHRREVHDKTAACDVCGKIVSARNLASHRAIHSDERNYTCHLCGASFKAKGSLDTHLRTHSEERPFSCATCGRSFKHRNNWKDHERSHLNIRDFVCHFCSKTFKQAKNLKQHLRQHDANPEIFTCPHCPSTFKYKYNMLAHVKTLHTGEMGRRVRRRVKPPTNDLLGIATSAVVDSSDSPVSTQQQQQQQQHVTSLQTAASGGAVVGPLHHHSLHHQHHHHQVLAPPPPLPTHLHHHLHQIHHQQQQHQQQQQHLPPHQHHQHQLQQHQLSHSLLAMSSGVSNAMHITPSAAVVAAAAGSSADQLSSHQLAPQQPAAPVATTPVVSGGHVVFIPNLQHHSIFS